MAKTESECTYATKLYLAFNFLTGYRVPFPCFSICLVFGTHLWNVLTLELKYVGYLQLHNITFYYFKIIESIYFSKFYVCNSTNLFSKLFCIKCRTYHPNDLSRTPNSVIFNCNEACPGRCKTNISTNVPLKAHHSIEVT